MKPIRISTNALYRADLIRSKMAESDPPLSNEDVGRLAKLTPRTVSRLRQGLDTRISTLRRVAVALKIPYLELFTSKPQGKSRKAA